MRCTVSVWSTGACQLKHLVPWNIAMWAKPFSDLEITPWRTGFYYRNLNNTKIYFVVQNRLKISVVNMILICNALGFYFLIFQNYISVFGIHILLLCPGASYYVCVLHRSSCWICNFNENNNQLSTCLLYFIKPLIYWHFCDMNIKYNLMIKVIQWIKFIMEC